MVFTRYIFIPASECTQEMIDANDGERYSPDGLTVMLKYDGDCPPCLEQFEKVDQKAMWLIVAEWDAIELESTL